LPLLIHSWRLFEADRDITTVLVVVFIGLAIAYLVKRALETRRRK
jgi:hypothetical protein